MKFLNIQLRILYVAFLGSLLVSAAAAATVSVTLRRDSLGNSIATEIQGLGSVSSIRDFNITSGVFGTYKFTAANGLPARQARAFFYADGYKGFFSMIEARAFILAAVDDGYIKMALVFYYVEDVPMVRQESAKYVPDLSATLDGLTATQVKDAYDRGYSIEYEVETIVSVSL